MGKAVIARTLVLVKPDGVERGLIGAIIHRFEQRGLRLVGLKLVKPSMKHIDAHYPTEPAWVARLGQKTIATATEYGLNLIEQVGTEDAAEIGSKVRQWLIEYLAEKSIVAMVIEGPHAVEVVRKIVGGTKPHEAPVGTIRGDFSADSPAMANVELRPIKNLVHASETPEEAAHEIKHWFTNEELQ